jgi:hypothetical protein
VFIALSSVPDATNRELETMTGLRITQSRRRVEELREKGVVVQSCERRCKQAKTTKSKEPDPETAPGTRWQVNALLEEKETRLRVEPRMVGRIE